MKVEYAVQAIPDFESKILSNRRTLRLFLPAGVDFHSARRFPLLIANDGQDFEELSLANTLTELVNCGQMQPVIVVAVPANADRLQEYGAAGQPNADGLGARADAYAQFITQELLPTIDSHYPTLPNPAGRALMGWSLGGLSAFDIVWNHPDLFSCAGIFSGSLWWHTAASTPAEVQAARIAHAMVRTSQPRPGLRLWFQAGTQDEINDRDQNGVIDSIQDTTELMDELSLKGLQTGKDMVYVQVEGGQHNQETWLKVLPQFLTWAFPPPA